MNRAHRANDWHTLSAKVALDTPHLRVLRERVQTPARPDGIDWITARRKAAVVVAPITPDGRLLLIRQERVPIREAIWEFPAGQIDADTTRPIPRALIRQTALRELEEETGWHLPRGGRLVPLGSYHPSPGFTDEIAHLFLARDVAPTRDGPRPEASESIAACKAFPPARLRAMIARGTIRDANTLAAFARLVARGFL